MAPLPPLRSKLLLLAAVGVVPGLILSLVLGYFLVEAQGYASTWYVGLADRNGRFLTRLPAPPSGDRVSADFQAAIQRTPEGWFQGRTLEGRDAYTAHKTSGLTGWTVGVAIPSGELNAVAYRASAYLALGTLVSLLVALAFAFWLSRYMAKPIAMLATAARRIGREPQPEAQRGPWAGRFFFNTPTCHRGGGPCSGIGARVCFGAATGPSHPVGRGQ